jgi:hypothetical protein
MVPETVAPGPGEVIETLGAAELATPVPDKLRVVGELEASLVMEMLDFTAPVALGAKLTCSVADCPAAIVAPETKPLAVKPLAAALTAVTCTVPWPELVIVAGSVLLFPTVTFPKLKLLGVI